MKQKELEKRLREYDPEVFGEALDKGWIPRSIKLCWEDMLDDIDVDLSYKITVVAFEKAFPTYEDKLNALLKYADGHFYNSATDFLEDLEDLKELGNGKS